ncbi:transporter substrate-binding domain-containing protein [Citricoccus nitrophenolicus]|uniref:Extracellular solute-binding protein (Family 3) n=1 Tax=Citricoccus muralis TaxID=169134 RepID=A0A3D9L9B9_9MICC|nr:transporter substrate-binding domain-containing protein [Citricoccus muralis]REE02905.1 extracellular solute-binding protein (family 3) [Citricoccus muralis]
MSISRKAAMTSGFLVTAVAVAASGCTSSAYPADPNGTFDDVSGGKLSVGVVHHPPYVDATGAEPSGSEVELIRAFAEEIDAEIEWTASGEEALITALETGDVDLMAGGLTDQSPWSSQAALTRSYAEDTGPDGKTVNLVLAVPLGENQMLGELERFLDERHPEVTP